MTNKTKCCDKALLPVDSPLGKSVEYSEHYQPSLLFAISRQEKRDELSIGRRLPFTGEDIWTAFELSWLSPSGLPQVAIGEFRFLAESPKIVESKSFKLYLNSLNQSRFADREAVRQSIQQDLTEITGAQVSVILFGLDKPTHQISQFSGECIDSQDLSIEQYSYQPSLLESANNSGSSTEVSESLYSHLLKSNCLITNQPDWASILIQYRGEKIDREVLLRYLISFRSHNEFHEQCVERIFSDLMKYCRLEELTVYARYTRRGGLDINPWRSNHLSSMANIRLVRQ
jgi:7-cyano-7-deazaguanine reductase